MVSKMDEPHQRTRSGKLSRPNRTQAGTSNLLSYRPATAPAIGLNNTVNLVDDKEASSTDDFFKQTPTSLTDLHVRVLTQVLNGICSQPNASIDRDWRKTWNIGAWNVPNKLCISVATMQPNISGCWVDIYGGNRSTLSKYATRYSDLNLPNSTCVVTGTRTPKIQGRWSLTLTQALLANGTIVEKQVSIANLNISGSKIFIWLLFYTGSKYLCTMTLRSTEILKHYIPDWCNAMSEVNSAQNFSIRLVAPEVGNDASQLTINKYGFVQYTGREENVQQLYSAIRISIRNVIGSFRLRVFLQSLTYRLVDE